MRPAKRPKSAPFLPLARPGAHLAFDARMLSTPRADLYFEVPAPLEFKPDHVLDGGVAVLCLHGPIEHHSSWWWQSYEDLAAQIQAALTASEVNALVLKIDSPGGIAAGMSEAHKAIRRMRIEYGKPIVAYVDEMACSAAYHIASAADEIWGPPAMHVGSVGVIQCTIDETEALDKAGVRVRYIVSGKRKADLHPGNPVDDAVVAAAQEKVDILAGQFFRLVAKSRGRNASALATPEAVEALQAAVFVGRDAQRVGLVDGVASWSKFLDLLRTSISASRELTDGSVSRARTPGATRARR